MKKNFLFALMFILINGMAHSQIANFGASDCGQWTKQPNEARKAWLLGYMSGLNAALSDNHNDTLNKVNSAEQILSFVDNYCRSNPLKTVWHAGNALFAELLKSK